jgi:hypothetical protein
MQAQMGHVLSERASTTGGAFSMGESGSFAGHPPMPMARRLRTVFVSNAIKAWPHQGLGLRPPDCPQT